LIHAARLISLLAFASAALASAAYAQDVRTALGWMDRGVEQARAESPNAVWTEVHPAPLGEYHVEGAVEIDGRPFIAIVTAADGVISSVQLSHEFDVRSAAECYDASRSIVAALEPVFGALYWDVQAIDGEHLVRTPGGSTIMVSAWRRWHGAVSLSALSNRRVDGFAVRSRIAARYGGHAAVPIFMTDLWAPTCEMQILVAPDRNLGTR
jgi:hypothetical protein